MFNVGGDDENYTVAQIAEIISAAVPGVQVHMAPGTAQEANYRVCFARIRSAIGFAPRRTVADGVAEIAASIARGAVPDYTDPRYNNYKALMSGEAMTALAAGSGPPAASARGRRDRLR